MVDAVPVLAAFVLALDVAGPFVGLVVEQRERDDAVGDVAAPGERRVGLADALHVEGLAVEIRRRFGVGDGKGDVSKLGHLVSPV